METAGDDDDQQSPKHRQLTNGRSTDKHAPHFADQIDKVRETGALHGHSESNGPPGGFDDTPVPFVPAGYTLKFTFHRASDLPFADINSFSSDPFIHATLKINLQKRHKQDPDLTFRTPTIRRNTSPEWNCQWIVAHVPSSGFYLKCRLYDEDPADHDDRLGNVHVRVSGIGEQWPGIKEQSYKIKKRMGSKRAYLFRGVAAIASRNVTMSGKVVISVECLGLSEGDGGRAYTVGPLCWSKHFSPLIGRLTGTTSSSTDDEGNRMKRYNFQANQIQLRGPPPAELYHRYVEFKPFVAGMFTYNTLKGRILNKALHHQHARVYSYDRSTIYGSFPTPSEDVTRLFLDMVHYAEGGRIFTYVLTLDAQWRFTETGKEFGIDLLSKHTMHSDISIYIAYAGEFFIRHVTHRFPPTFPSSSGHDTQENSSERKGGPSTRGHSNNPSHYELFIDNDSGTYRPHAKDLPLLKEFMSANLPGLKITTLDCKADAERMDKLKGEQREWKQKEGHTMMFKQGNLSSSSLSSSDEEDLDRRARESEPKNKLAKGIHNVKEPKQKLMAWIDKQTGPAEARPAGEPTTKEKDGEQDGTISGSSPM